MRRTTVAATLAAGAFALGAASAAARPGEAARSVEQDLQAYALHYLPFDPDSKISVERAKETLPGFQGYKLVRTGRYEKLAVDRLVYVSIDRKWFFAGDSIVNPSSRPVTGPADLDWVEARYTKAFNRAVHAVLVSERDAGGLKGVALQVDTGYMPVRMAGYVSPDGRAYFQGSLWDFTMDPRVERRRRIDLSANRATGPASARVTVVEFGDMECGYCKMRGLQMDRLLESNAGTVAVRRHYKLFPLWLGHVWAMKAASAADCLFQHSPQSMFPFKLAVYARQESMTVAGIDELALNSAEAAGVLRADYLSCYLQDQSFARIRKDIEEGYRVGVLSTPTYFVDGTEITWLEDKVMEDFLRTLFPAIKTINYAR
ncbi:MAG TPA: DsbA family protein [Thermoanaerobaculia bacterium]|nr:DsbA family protein [Thermoanaerobaculia bacterium]